MKRKQIVKRLRELGWERLRQGRRHDIWGRGCERLAIPRHAEINEYTAEAIVKEAKGE